MNTKFLKFVITGSIVLFFTTLFISCDNDMTDPIIHKEESSSLNSKVGVTSLTTSILSAQTANDIPTNFYRVSNVYKTNYIHLLQKSGECSWSNYVLCGGAIARAKGHSYPATYAQITTVKTWCGSNSLITKLSNYCGSNDSNKLSRYLKVELNNSNGRFNMVKSMLDHINTKQTPFIVVSSVPKISGGRIGHYFTVWSIDWKQGGTGSVIWYTNTLDGATGNFDTQVKNMDLSAFLDAMCPLNPDASYYNALYLW